VPLVAVSAFMLLGGVVNLLLPPTPTDQTVLASERSADSQGASARSAVLSAVDLDSGSM